MNCDAQSLIAASRCYDCIPPGLQSAVQMMLACEWANAGPGGCSDPVVTDWLQRLADDFQPMPSQDTVNAVCDFCVALRAYGIMDDMLVVNPVIPDTLLAMRYPLIYQVGNGNSPFINHNFVAANLTQDGLVGDESVTDQYMDTGFIPDTNWGVATESGGLSVYESDDDPAHTLGQCELGAETGVPEHFDIRTFDTVVGDGETTCWRDTSANQFGLAADTPSFYTSNRITNTDFRVYQGNTGGFNLLNTNVANQAGWTLPDIGMYFMAKNDTGTASLFTGKRVSFMAIHEGFDATEAENFFEAVQALRIALLGGYV